MVSPAPSTPPTPLKCESVLNGFSDEPSPSVAELALTYQTFGVATLIVTVPVPMPATPGFWSDTWYVNESEPVNPTAGL